MGHHTREVVSYRCPRSLSYQRDSRLTGAQQLFVPLRQYFLVLDPLQQFCSRLTSKKNRDKAPSGPLDRIQPSHCGLRLDSKMHSPITGGRGGSPGP